MLRRISRIQLITAFCLVSLPSAPAWSLTGGPDGYGYTFIDSDEPGGPVYAWIDISATGTATGIDDDEDLVLSLPFTFWYYGQAYTSVTLGDGLLLFGGNNVIDNTNRCVPGDNDYGSDTLVMGLWDDLNAADAAADDVYYETQGVAPDRMFIVQYNEVPHYGSNTIYTFEMILVETTNEILFQYQSLSGPDSQYTNGGSATVGIQPSLADGLEYSCNSDAILHDELAVRFDVVCDDLDGDGLGACDGDCDDTDPLIGPTVAESDDGEDNDCDGLVDEDFVLPGDLVITELMVDPDAVPDAVGEWIEVYNASARDVDLSNWTLADGSGSDTIGTGVVVGAGAHALFASHPDPATNGGLPTPDWVFDAGSIGLTNGGDPLILSMGGTVIDELQYAPGDWPLPTGTTLYLDPDYRDATANDLPHPWCETPTDASYDYGGLPGDYGTPGEANPAGLCCSDDDGDGVSTCEGDCNDGSADAYPGATEVHDSLDNDCDGFADEGFIVHGAVVISEFMDEPSGIDAAAGEWIELYNTTALDIDLIGWQMSDSEGEGFVIYQSTVVPAMGFAILAVDDDPAANGGLPWVDFEYSYDSFMLRSYDPDDMVLSMDDYEIDEMEYANSSPWESQVGQSNFLDPAALDADANDDEENWCLTPDDAEYEYGAGNFGTPGAANPDIDDDADGFSPCAGDCDDTDAEVHPDAAEDCEDGIDNDCDGDVDGEDDDCASGDDDTGDDDTADDDTESPVDDDSAGDEGGDCSCRLVGGQTAPARLAGLLLVLAACRRWRSRSTGEGGGR